MPRLIALDLGCHSVKATTYKVSGRSQLELERRYHHRVPQNGPMPSLEQRMVALDALLDEQPRLAPLSGDIVVLAWPSHEAAFHRIQMPFSDRAQIEKTLPFAVESEVPFDLEEMALGWRIAESAGQTQVLAVLSKRERLSEVLRALGERSIDPAVIHVDADLFGPFGAAGAITQDDGPPVAPLVAVLDLGHVHTSLSVVRNGVVQIARSINVGGWTFTRAIQDALGCSWSEAEELKHGATQAEVSPEDEDTDPGVRRRSGYGALPAAARQAIDGAIGLLLAEVRSTLIKAEDQLKGDIAEIRLCGGSARIDEIWDYLAADLAVPVGRASSPKGGATPGPFSLTEALALAAVAGAAQPVDLRVGSLAYRGRTDVLKAALGYGVAGAVVFSLAATVLSGVWYGRAWSEQLEVEAAVREIVLHSFPEVLPTQVDTMDKAKGVMQGFTQDAVQRAEVLGEGENAIPPTTDALYQLTTAFPAHSDVVVELSDLIISPTVISFNAETDGYSSSAAVEERLKQNPRFKTATKGTETRLANGRVRFPISIPLGDAEPQEGG